MKVYLAGGFHSGWQQRVKDELPGNSYFDPRSDEPMTTEEYTARDIAMIEACDLVFAYFEGSNPAGYDMMLEIGYAKALGKRVIFVDEKSPSGSIPILYLGMARTLADSAVRNFEDGLSALRIAQENTP